MDNLTHSLLLSSASLLCALFICRLLVKSFSHSKLPPGPSGLPFIGAALQIPREGAHIVFMDWAAHYGSLVGLTIFGKRLALLNTSELSERLLNGKGSIYSERPPFPMLEMMGFMDWNIGIMPLGRKHKLARQLMNQAISANAISQYHNLFTHETHKLLKDLVLSPDTFFKSIRRCNTNTLLHIFFGIQEASQEKDLVLLNDELMDATSLAGLPTSYAVNTFPILKYWPKFLPGGGFKYDVDHAINLVNKILKIPTGASDPSEKHSTSFLAYHASTGNPEEHEAAKCVALTTYGAGVETSTATLLTFILAMVLYPDVQQKAYTELNHYLSGSLPSLQHRGKELQYIEAILSETYRWAPAGHFGLPRMLTQDDYVNGYLLPKGTVVMSNVWAIMHDSTQYKDPDTFNPERFLGNNPEPNPREHVFGYGRRLCPGRFLAEEKLWLEIATILTVFELKPICDEFGNPIKPTIEFTAGVMSHPKPFKCIFEPRSSELSEKILHGY